MTFLALHQLADWNTYEGIIHNKRELARLAQISVNTIFGTVAGRRKRSYPGTLHDLQAWGYIQIESVPPSRLRFHLHLSPVTVPLQPTLFHDTARDPERRATQNGARGRAAPARGRAAPARGRAAPLSYTDSSHLSEGAELDGSPRTSPTTNPPTSPTRGYWAAQFYADEFLKVTGRPALRRDIGAAARNAKELEEQGRPRSLLEELLRECVLRGKSPKLLQDLAIEHEARAGKGEQRAVPVGSNGRGYTPFQRQSDEYWEHAARRNEERMARRSQVHG